MCGLISSHEGYGRQGMLLRCMRWGLGCLAQCLSSLAVAALCWLGLSCSVLVRWPLLARSTTTCCLQLPTCSLSPGRSKTSLSLHGEAKGLWRVPRCSAQRVITPKVTSVRGPERRDSTTLRVATAHYVAVVLRAVL